MGLLDAKLHKKKPIIWGALSRAPVPIYVWEIIYPRHRADPLVKLLNGLVFAVGVSSCSKPIVETTWVTVSISNYFQNLLGAIGPTLDTSIFCGKSSWECSTMVCNSYLVLKLCWKVLPKSLSCTHDMFYTGVYNKAAMSFHSSSLCWNNTFAPF